MGECVLYGSHLGSGLWAYLPYGSKAQQDLGYVCLTLDLYYILYYIIVINE